MQTRLKSNTSLYIIQSRPTIIGHLEIRSEAVSLEILIRFWRQFDSVGKNFAIPMLLYWLRKAVLKKAYVGPELDTCGYFQLSYDEKCQFLHFLLNEFDFGRLFQLAWPRINSFQYLFWPRIDIFKTTLQYCKPQMPISGLDLTRSLPNLKSELGKLKRFKNIRGAARKLGERESAAHPLLTIFTHGTVSALSRSLFLYMSLPVSQ